MPTPLRRRLRHARRGVAYSMAVLLGQWGCECLLAGSEDEAMEQLSRRRLVPDIVIADHRLREDRTGAQAIRRIHKEYNEDIPALIITGETAPDRLREAATSGYRLMHKPVSPEQLRLLLIEIRRLRSVSTEGLAGLRDANLLSGSC